MKLLDSTFLIDFLRKKEDVKEKLEEMFLENPYTTRINIFETFVGIYAIKLEADREKKFADANALFARLRVLELNSTSAQKAAEICGNNIIKGMIIEPADCLIAGIALSNGISTIITRNTKHFQGIEGLKVEGY